jgi:hypothetical protein
MKVIKLVRPALEPRRHLELQVREAQSGLVDFVMAMAQPTSGWLEVEVLPAEPETEADSPRCGLRNS